MATIETPAAPLLLVTEVTSQTLQYLDQRPGAANIDISRAVDVRHESQMSRHLARLERAGMVTRRKEGRSNVWRFTDRGEEAARSLVPSPSRADADAACAPVLSLKESSQ